MIAKRHTLANALRVAAGVYESDAHTASCTPNHDRIEKAFRDQAALAVKLADEIEQSNTIDLED